MPLPTPGSPTPDRLCGTPPMHSRGNATTVRAFLIATLASDNGGKAAALGWAASRRPVAPPYSHGTGWPPPPTSWPRSQRMPPFRLWRLPRPSHLLSELHPENASVWESGCTSAPTPSSHLCRRGLTPPSHPPPAEFVKERYVVLVFKELGVDGSRLAALSTLSVAESATAKCGEPPPPAVTAAETPQGS